MQPRGRITTLRKDSPGADSSPALVTRAPGGAQASEIRPFPPIDESAKAHNPSGVRIVPENAITGESAEDLIVEGILARVPPDWVKGQLLNVRNNGAEYVVTLLGEEFDPRYPHRALKFPNSVACQAFVSNWYSREHSDPRAF